MYMVKKKTFAKYPIKILYLSYGENTLETSGVFEIKIYLHSPVSNLTPLGLEDSVLSNRSGTSQSWAEKSGMFCVLFHWNLFSSFSVLPQTFLWLENSPRPPTHPRKITRKWIYPRYYGGAELIFSYIFGNSLACWPRCPTHAHKTLLPNLISHIGFCGASLSPLFSGINLKQCFLTSVGMLPWVRSFRNDLQWILSQIA